MAIFLCNQKPKSQSCCVSIGFWNPDQDDFSDVFCAGYMLSELVALETKTQIAGVTNIADATGIDGMTLEIPY